MELSDSELQTLLSDAESDRSERKESFRGDAPKAVREAVCAFANDLPGHGLPGVVFIGARDDGGASGLQVDDELLRALADIKSDGNIVPPPTLSVAKRSILGAEFAVVTVQPADSPPVRFKGTIWIRVGPRRGIASAQDERILNERRRHKDRPFDAQPVPSAKLEDLDLRYYEQSYLPAAFAPDVLDANDRSLEQRLAATKMIVGADRPTPTVLGILALANRTRDFLPGAYVQFLRLAGTSLADEPVDEQVIDGAMGDVLRKIDQKLVAHNRSAIDFTSGMTESRRQPYPMVALQQLVRNGVLHRNYEGTNAPVKVYWYDDRIEILSPGGPFGSVSVDNFGEPGLTDYRNPNLAEALRVLGFVQRFGAGLPIARQQLAANGNPASEWDVRPDHVAVTLRPAS